MIVGPTTTMLRSGVARSCGLQPILMRSTTTTTTTTSPYSSFPSSPFSARSKLTNPAAAASLSTTTAAKPSSILLFRATAQPPQRQQAHRRHASTKPSSNPHDQDAAAAARSARAATAAAAADPNAPPLDWNTFFQLRKTRRRLQLGFSAIMSLASGSAGAVVLSTGAADALTSQVPLDPFMTMGLMTIGCVALGWLAGPSLGSAVFYLFNRKYKVPMTVVCIFPSSPRKLWRESTRFADSFGNFQKESQFFARIKKNRVDPSNSSTGNPGRRGFCYWPCANDVLTTCCSTRLLR